MELINQIGHLQHWGLSPAQNLLKHVKAQPREEGGERPLRVLMSGVSDVRHILKTLCDIEVEEAESKRQKFSRVEIYFHETNKELLCRCLLFLHVLHETSLNFEERIELFLDLYGNAMIKYSSIHHLQGEEREVPAELQRRPAQLHPRREERGHSHQEARLPQAPEVLRAGRDERDSPVLVKYPSA